MLNSMHSKTCVTQTRQGGANNEELDNDES